MKINVEKLEQYRRWRNINWSEMARDLGVSPSTLCLVLQGKRAPGLKLLSRLAELTGAKMDEFLEKGGEEE